MKQSNIIAPIISGAVAAVAAKAVKSYFGSRSTSSTVMPLSKPSYRVRKPRAYKRKPAKTLNQRVVSFHRTSTPGTYSVTSGSSQTTGTQIVRLNDVFTDDIKAMFDVYRIKKVVFEISPLADPASGLAANNVVTDFYLGNEPTGQDGVAVNPQDICRYANYRYKSCMSGEKMIYTFYPKILSSVGANSGTVIQGSYGGPNPWLACSATGLAIPHYNLHYGMKLAATLSASAVTYRYNYTIHFECMNTR